MVLLDRRGQERNWKRCAEAPLIQRTLEPFRVGQLSADPTSRRTKMECTPPSHFALDPRAPPWAFARWPDRDPWRRGATYISGNGMCDARSRSPIRRKAARRRVARRRTAQGTCQSHRRYWPHDTQPADRRVAASTKGAHFATCTSNPAHTKRSPLPDRLIGDGELACQPETEALGLVPGASRHAALGRSLGRERRWRHRRDVGTLSMMHDTGAETQRISMSSQQPFPPVKAEPRCDAASRSAGQAVLARFGRPGAQMFR
jgi:hypothetical protein